MTPVHRPSWFARLLAWLHPRPEFKQAPPLRNPHYLHHSTKRNAAEVWPINWSAMRGKDLR